MLYQEVASSKDIIMSSVLPDSFVSSREVGTIIEEPERDSSERFPKKHTLYTFSLFKIMQTENTSNIYQLTEFDTETALTDNSYKELNQGILPLKVLETIDKIIDEDENGLFNSIDKYKVSSVVSKMLSEVSIEWNKVSNQEFYERIKRILILEAMSGILKELKPEQVKTFEESIKRRPLFK